MSLRSVALLIPFVFTLVVGAWILFEPRQGNVSHDLKRAGGRESIGVKQLSTKTSQVPQDILSKLTTYSTTFRSNKELFLYGSIAVFGILIMGLAIAGAKSTPKDTTASALEVLKQEKERAEHVARLKSEFLNQVSHELRTPLAVIIGYIECITDGLYGEIESKHQEILQIVAKQSSHLKNMIDQILIFSRLEANKQPLRIEEFPVSKIFNDLRDTFDFLCKQKGLELSWELSNIFDPFMQVHKTSSENSRGGIGLGLSIVKKHVDQMKGTMNVESELGKGTTFKIVLPRAYEERGSATHRLRNLIKLPIPRTREAAVSLASSTGKVSEAK